MATDNQKVDIIEEGILLNEIARTLGKRKADLASIYANSYHNTAAEGIAKDANFNANAMANLIEQFGPEPIMRSGMKSFSEKDFKSKVDIYRMILDLGNKSEQATQVRDMLQRLGQ